MSASNVCGVPQIVALILAANVALAAVTSAVARARTIVVCPPPGPLPRRMAHQLGWVPVWTPQIKGKPSEASLTKLVVLALIGLANLCEAEG